MVDLTLLDQSAPKLLEAAKDLPVGDLMVLLAAENAGKTRKSAVAALEELIGSHAAVTDAVCHSEAVETVENVTEASTVHVGDGRRIAPGETLEVAADVAAILVASELCR